MKLALFNLRYSPNLGDGLLSECLEKELRAGAAETQAFSLDLAGRQGYAAGNKYRRFQLWLLQHLPGRARQALVGLLLRNLLRRQLMPEWRSALADVDAVVVGGGNLFADADLNFPLKIHGALTEAKRSDLPFAVYGVGVTPNWTRIGARLFTAALTGGRMVEASVRDDCSGTHWRRLLGPRGVRCARVVCDPGLLAADHFGAEAAVRGPTIPHIGIGVIDPVVLRYHGGERLSRRHFADRLSQLIEALSLRPCRISLFSNGSPEDRSFLANLERRFTKAGLRSVAIVSAFANPAGLARFIAGCDLVMAHRMHACIAAYSYQVPTIGFAWDAKMASFFDLIERPDHLVDFAAVAPEHLAGLAFQALGDGIDPALHQRLLTQCRDDIARLRAALSDAVAASPRRA